MWLSNKKADELVAEYGSPLFVYSQKMLRARAEELMFLKLPFGHTVRYAVKANPNPGIIRLFDACGLHFDASSSYEAVELLRQGIDGKKISLSSQQSAHDLPELLASGIRYVATSMHQLELLAASVGPGSNVGLRVNPPTGYGHNNRLTTAGSNSSFGLWHEYVHEAIEIAKSKRITIDRLHVHVGTGAEPKAWAHVIEMALDIVRLMPDVTVLDIGGGFNIAYSGSEIETDMKKIAHVFAQGLEAFASETDRRLSLETESGRWLVAHAGLLLAKIDDIVNTGKNGHEFLRLNTGMNDIIRPAMYGAQHRIEVMNDSNQTSDYVIVGHNCETGDILTTVTGDPEGIEPRVLNKAQIGDLVSIADVGAYCASFSAHGYNAFPSAKEIFVD